MCADLFQICGREIKSFWESLLCTWQFKYLMKNLRLCPQSFYLKTKNLMKVVLIPMLKQLIF